MTSSLTTEVLIIGGGPAGILSAIYLDLMGVSSIVVERQYEISQHPKAHELSARSIEILGQLGFTLEELQKEASPHKDASRIVFGHTINTVIGEIDLLEGGNDEKYTTHLASPLPYLNLSQTVLETLMRQKLQACTHSELLLGQQWEKTQDGDHGVKSEILKRADNSRYTISSKYVIAADGAGSRSRKALGIAMIGEEKIAEFLSVYFELNLRDFLKKTAKLFWIMNPMAPGTFIAHHIEKRWVYHFPIFTPYEQKEHYTEEVLRERILTALGDERIPLKIKSISLWRMTSQIAERFRANRVLLVGDAAHRFPPTGGLGMNSGIGDVQNLCWKLALVIRGVAHERLLDTYEQERRPVVTHNGKESLRNYFKIWEVPKAMGLNPKAIKWQAIILNHPLMKVLPQRWIKAGLQRIQAKLTKKILAIPKNPKLLQKVRSAIKDQTEHFDRIGLDLGYFYPKGAIIFNANNHPPPQKVSEYQPSVEPGTRFPHFWIFHPNKKVSSHAWLSPDKFTLLCNDVGKAWWVAQANALPPAVQALVEVVEVERLLTSQPATALERTFYPIAKVPILLIRPDGQIAWKPEYMPADLKLTFQQLIPTK